MPRIARRRAHDVFISYAFSDRDAAEAICAALEADGIRCWIAPRDGTPGASYAAFLVDAIAASRAVVLVFSRSANRSEAVLSELEIAASRKRLVVPIRIESVEPNGAAEFYVRRRHWIDAPQPIADSLPMIVSAVRTALLPVRARRAAASPALAAPPERAPPPRGNLPQPATSFVGRERERTDVVALLQRSRAITLWGPGGAGKTRLAIEVARTVKAAHADGVWFVDLAAVSDEAGVAPAIAEVLDVREVPNVSVVESLVGSLRARTLLLILDNCEHVLGAAGEVVARILAAVPEVRVLCTSREPLRVDGEHVYAIGPLGAAAVDLFVERAAAAGVTYGDAAARETIAAICGQLDGIPFAIELAAARARSMPLAEIAASLDMRFHLLTGGRRSAPARHQTLRSTLDWSYGLLEEAHRRSFMRAAAFAGSWTAAAFRAVVGDGDASSWETLDALGALVDKSLVAHDQATGRYRQLETTRSYAAELLRSSGDEEHVRRRHAEHVLTTLRDAVRAWRAAPSDAPLRALLADRDNANAALQWSLFERHDVLLGARLTAALGVVWEFTGAYQSGFGALEAARAALPDDAPDGDVAAVQLATAGLAHRREEPVRTLDHARRAAELAARCGDAPNEARAFWLIGLSLRRVNDLDGAELALQRALALYREASDGRGVTACRAELAFIAGQRGDRAYARETYRELAAMCAAGDDVRGESFALLNLAEFAFADDDVDDAIATAQHIIARANAAGAVEILPFATGNLAAYLLAAGALEEASLQIAHLLDLVEGDQARHWIVVAVQALALREARSGRLDEARALVALVGGTARDADRALDPAEAYVCRELAAVLGVVPARDGVLLAEVVARAHAVLQQGHLPRRTRETSFTP